GGIDGQLVLDGQSSPVFRLRFGSLPQVAEQDAQAVVAGGQGTAILRHSRGVGDQFLLYRQGSPGFRLPHPFRLAGEQGPQVLAADGKGVAVVGDGREVGLEFLPERQGGPVGGRRLRPLAQIGQQEAQVVVTQGQVAAVVRDGREGARQLLLDG